LNALQPIARKLARSWCYVSVHRDLHREPCGKDADCIVCDKREAEILAQLKAAAKNAADAERAACLGIAKGFSAGIAKAFDEGRVTDSGGEYASGQASGADEVAEAIEERGVELDAMGCVACQRGYTITHANGLMGHDLPTFQPCPVKQADL